MKFPDIAMIIMITIAIIDNPISDSILNSILPVINKPIIIKINAATKTSISTCDNALTAELNNTNDTDPSCHNNKGKPCPTDGLPQIAVPQLAIG